MIQKNEFVMLMLAIGVLIFIVGNRFLRKKLMVSKILIGGFLAFFIGWVATVLDGLFWGQFLNLLGHLCYLTGSVLIVIWCWKTLGKKEF